MKVLFIVTACKKRGPIQQTLNIIKNLNRNEFEPFLLTLYQEDEDSLLKSYLPYVTHYYVPTGKLDIITGRDNNLRKKIEEISPDIIHSLGVFPDYAVSRINKWKQIITLRNFVYDDYPAKFGMIRGNILAKLHLYAMKHTNKTVTCSESLARIYKEKLGLRYDYVRNGVDIEEYKAPSQEEKLAIKKGIGLPEEAFIFVYTGQMIERKNVGFLLEVFCNSFKGNDNVRLLMIGGGALLEGYKSQYGSMSNIDFRGSVNNVNYYLKACDAYVSTSKSEGLPNGVLEAMATGLPVVLSDIEQHLEIYNVDHQIGYVYNQGNADELGKRLNDIKACAEEKGKVAYKTVHQHFSAAGMSRQYQKLYREIAKK